MRDPLSPHPGQPFSQVLRGPQWHIRGGACGRLGPAPRLGDALLQGGGCQAEPPDETYSHSDETGEGVVWSPDQDRKRVALRVDDASRAPVSESCWKTNRLTRTASNHPMFPDKWTVQRRCHGAEDEADDDPSP